MPCRWGSGALHCKPGVGKRELNLYEGIVNEERKYIETVVARLGLNQIKGTSNFTIRSINNFTFFILMIDG